MKPSKLQWICLVAGCLGLSTTLTALAESKPSPYQGIIERNPFGLKPPPEPPPPAPTTPVVPPAKVVLTGIHSMFGPPRALVEITETEAGKAAEIRRPILKEGERDGSVEIVSIDLENSLVKIRNSGIETNLTFPVAKAVGAAPATPASGGFVPPHAGAPGAVPAAPINTTAASSAGHGSGVTIVGGASSTSAATPRGGVYGAGGAAPYGGAGAATPGFDANGLRSIPTRAVRTDGVDASAPVDPVAQYNAMQRQHQAATAAGIQMPPLPGAAGAGNGAPSPPPLPTR